VIHRYPTPPGAIFADCYIIWGQSNSRGRAPLAALPSTLTGARSNVMFWNGSSFAALQANTNNGYPEAGFDWGPEMLLSDLAQRHHGRTVYVIKHALSGTHLTPTTLPTWNPDVRGSIYDAAHTQLQNALRAIRNAGRIPVVRGFIWGQGEADAQLSITQANYQDKQQRLFQSVRDAVGNPNLPISDMLVRSENFTVTTVNGAKAAVASALGNVQLLKTDAFDDIGDNVHYSAPAALAWGRHAFEHFTGLTYPMPASLPARVFEIDVTRQDGYTLSGIQIASEARDRSPNARHFSQSVAADRPGMIEGPFGSFGFGVLRSTAGKGLEGPISPVAAGSPFTVYAVVTNVLTASGAARIWLSGGDVNTWQLFFRANLDVLELGSGTTSVLKSTVSTPVGATQIAVAVYGGAAGNHMRINGVEVNASTTVVSFPNTLPLRLFASLSATGTAIRNTAADFSHMGMFAQALSIAEAQVLEGYLAHRLNLTSLLPSGHPYKTNAP
jgi:hypothetical protein